MWGGMHGLWCVDVGVGAQLGGVLGKAEANFEDS